MPGKPDNPGAPDASRIGGDSLSAALAAARMGAWETDLVNGTRKWSQEAMTLFGFDLPGGIGTVGGDADEYIAALHPDDRHIVSRFRSVARHQDFYEGDYRIVRPDGSIRWVTGRALVAKRGADGAVHRTVTVVADITEQKTAEEHVQFLLDELSHRSRNLITVIQGIARLAVRTSSSLEDFERRFDSRLGALATSHALLAEGGWQAAQLGTLVRDQVSTFVGEAARILISGPPVLINANGAQIIGLAMHELATNAVKHGSLACPAGKVSIGWDYIDAADQRRLRLRWQESGGPPASPPTRTGFGQTVVRDMFTRALHADVTLDFVTEGFRWTADVPTDAIAVPART